MVVSGELNNGREAGGRMGLWKNVRKVNKWNRPWYGPHRAHNQLKWWLRDSRGLYYEALESHSILYGPKPLVRMANGLGRSSQQKQKQTTQDFFILAVKLDSVLMCLCVCDEKIFNFLSWAIRPVLQIQSQIVYSLARYRW